MSSRPRRSVVPTSYQLVIPKLPGDSDEESQEQGEDAEDGAGPGDGTNVEGAVANGAGDGDDDDDDEDDDDSASGSEYAPDVAKGKDGESKPESDADSAEMEFEANGTISNPEDDDEDSAAGEAELDDRISIADSENLLPHERELSPGAPGRSQGLKHGRVSFVGDASRFDSPAGSSSAAPIRVLGRTPFAVIGNVHPNNKKTNPRRKLGTSAGTSKRTPLYDLSFGPSHYPSPRLLLARDFDDQCHCPRNGAQAGATRENGLQVAEALTDKQRLFLVKRTAYLPFGPEYTACEDIGWYKGKTIQQVDPGTGNTVNLRSARWGGWYDTVHTQLKDFDIISDIGHVLPYLPHNLYPAKPAPVHLVCVSKTEKEEENEDEPWDMTGLPTVPPFTDGASMPAENDIGELSFTMPDVANNQPNGHSRAGSTLDEDDGVFRLRMGLIGDVDETDGVQDASLPHQTMVEIERFTSHRLDAHLPNKSGHILNAGGPVFGLDWCPQADDDFPAAREYLAVSTVSDHTAVSYDTSVVTPRQGLVQIWSLDTSVRTDMADATSGLKGKGMSLELAILLDTEAIQLTWCPRGGQVEDHQGGSNGTDSYMGNTSIPRLGVLAVLDTRGRLAIYGVPVPTDYRKAAGISNNDLVFLKPKSPLLRLDLGTMPVCSFEWANHDMLAVGTTDGHVAIFYIEAALTSGAPSVEATYILPVHETPVTMLSIIREPPMSPDGRSCIDADPTRIATSALDGSSKVVDLQDWGSIIDFGHERAIRVVTRYQPAIGGIVYCDQELGNRYIALRLRDFGASTRIVSHNGAVLDLASSDNHPFMASASADGSCALSNPLRRLKRSSHSAHYLTKVYRMDFNRRSGEYRMLDNMLPDSRINHESRILRRMKSNKKAAKKKKPKPKPKKAKGKGKGKARDQDGDDPTNGAVNNEAQEEAADEEEEEEEEDDDDDEDEYADPDTLASVSWPPEVAVNRVAWHRSLRRAHVLASGMACGLVRVDIVSKPWTLELPPRFVDPSSILQAPDEDDDD